MTRNEARETAMQILYEMDTAKAIQDGIAEDAASRLVSERMSGNHVTRCTELLQSILNHLTDIDGAINRCSTKWKTSRMPKVDLAIMRLAIGEILYSDDVPEAVAINEAINLAKKYSTENSAKFVHGVLGAFSKNR